MNRITALLLPIVFAIALGIGASSADGSERGIVRGKVVDLQTGTPIPAADVTAVGKGWGTMTDPRGMFELSLPPGDYTLRVFHISYEQSLFDGVVVDPKAPLRLEAELRPNEHAIRRIRIEEDEVRSAEAALLRNRRKSTALSDGISAEQIGRASSSDAGDALKRVTGVTVSEDKFVQVRGLGGRYSNTVFNGSKIPSPEPNKSVVPMDLFPAGLLQNVSVSKTFTPDQSGDFAGGSVRIETKDLPRDMTISFSSSVGYNARTTFLKTLGYGGGSLDFFGFDDGARALPGRITSSAGNRAIRERGLYSDVGFTAEEIQAFGRSFANVWSPRSSTAPVDHSYGFSLGNKASLFGLPIGYVYSLNYGNEHKTVTEERNSYRTSVGEDGTAVLSPFTEYEVRRGTNSVLWGQVMNGTLKFSRDHRLILQTMYTRSADNEARIYEGYNADRGTDLRNYRLRFIERGLLTTQFGGRHTVTSLRNSALDWQTSYSRVTRNEPDTREVLYERREGEWIFFDITQSGSRFFFDLEEHEFGSKADWVLPLGPSPTSPSKLKAGFAWSGKNRTFDGRRFRFDQSDGIHESVDLAAEPEEILSEENIAPGLYELRETTRSVDNYEASHDVAAAYVLGDLPLASNLRALGGVRVEHSDQRLTSFDPFGGTALPVATDLRTTDFLPSVNLKYEWDENSSLRSAYSRTVARPDFRELAPFEFTDFIGGRAEIGNPDLNRTLIENYDFRWERYGEGGDLLAITAFFKRFDDPIEQIVQPSATLRVGYENAEWAETHGLEMEWRKNLGAFARRLRRWTLNTNVTVMETSVALRIDGTGVQTSNRRPLQGQSPFVVNAALAYDHDRRGTNATLLVNVFGRRITEVGAQGLPDVYEDSRVQLDFNLKQRIRSNMKLKLSAKNLLDPDHRYVQGNEVYRRYAAGRSVSLGISYER